MSTMEKLLLQIFERKKRIIEQVKQQTQLFDHHLASKCLLDGFAPPTFLFESHPSELKKEEIISGLLVPHYQTANVFHTAFYQNPVIACHNEGLTNVSCTNVCAFNKEIIARDGSSVLQEVTTSSATCPGNEVINTDLTVASPQDPTDAREKTLENCSNHSHSVQIQRSRSRQRALEIRNSAKASKIQLSSEGKVGGCSSHLNELGSKPLPHDHAKELAKPIYTKNGSCMENGKKVNEFSNNQKHNVCHDADTAFRSFSQQTTVGDDIRRSVKEHDLTESFTGLMEQISNADELTDMTNPSSVFMARSCAAAADSSGRVSKPERSISYPRLKRETLGMDNSSIIAAEETMLGQNADRSRRQPSDTCNLNETVICSTYNEHNEASKAIIGDSWSKERVITPYSGRLIRGRSSKQFHPVNECQNLDTYSHKDKEDGGSEHELQSDHDTDFKEMVNIDESCQVRAKACESQLNEQRGNAYSGRITRSRSSNLQLNNANPVRESSTTIFKDTDGAFGKFMQSYEGDDPKEFSGTHANIVSCNKNNDITNVVGYDAVVVDTDMDSDGLGGHCLVSSQFTCEGISIGEKALTQSARLVNPKQLDFDDVENFNLTEATDPASCAEQGKLSVKKISSNLLSVDMLDKAASIQYPDKPRLSNQLPLQEERDSSSKEEKVMRDSLKFQVRDRPGAVDGSCSTKWKTNPSSSQNQSANSYVVVSWPQYKRKKTDNQHLTTVFTSPRLVINDFQHMERDQVEDAIQRNFDKKEVEDMQEDVAYDVTKESEFSSLKLQNVDLSSRGKFRSTDINLAPKQQEFHSEASGTRFDIRASHVCLLEKPELVDPTSIESVATGLQIEEENCVLTEPEDINDMLNAEVFTFSEKATQEQKPHPKEIYLSSCSVGSPSYQLMDISGSDQSRPVLERFMMATDYERPCISGSQINFDKLDLPDDAIERASILERLCKSACLETPLSNFTTAYKLHRTPNLDQSMPNILSERELKNILDKERGGGKHPVAVYNFFKEELKSMFQERSNSDALPFTNAQSAWDIKRPSISPPRKIWDGTASKSASSGKKTSSIPELPCISEENENTEDRADMFQQGICSALIGSCAKREPLADIATKSNFLSQVCEPEMPDDRCSLASLTSEFSITDACSKPRMKLGKKNSNKKHISKEKENKSPSHGMNGVTKIGKSLRSRFSKPKLSGKTSLRKEGPSLSERESKPTNIVSNLTSFIPLVQQKQAAAVVTGKRDVKVKALEAAEAAKRLAEKKENERKMKKEALKLERAKLEEQNLRQLELEKEKKAEWKKKEAEMAAKKRQREEEERREKARKRKRVEETRKQQLAQEEKLHAEKQEKQIKRRVADQRAYERKDLKHKPGKQEDMDKAKRDRDLLNVSETEPRAPEVSTVEISKACVVPENNQARSCDDNSKIKVHLSEPAENDQLISNAYNEPQYEISPYKGSDDEEEDEDEISKNKHIPSWASKKSVAVAVTLQQSINPESIFAPESFYSVLEVLLPRKLLLK